MGTEFNPNLLIIPAILLLLCMAAGIYFINRQRQKVLLAEQLAGFAAAAVGAFFGLLTYPLYRSKGELTFYGNGVENPYWVGPVAGGTLGLLAGIWFLRHLRKLHATGCTPTAILGRGVAVGIGLGVLCSTMVHILLMTAYLNLNFWPMLIGAGFGLAAGLAAGLVISTGFILSCKLGLIKAGEPS